jgi:hypothetical protein
MLPYFEGPTACRWREQKRNPARQSLRVLLHEFAEVPVQIEPEEKLTQGRTISAGGGGYTSGR